MMLIALVFIAWMLVSVPAALLLGAMIREVGLEVRRTREEMHRDR